MEFPKDKKIILFDGVCNLCEQSVQFIIKHDKKDVFRFVALQSELGKKITHYIGLENNNIDSIVLYIPGVAYFYKSNAALEIVKDLDGVFQFATFFKILPVGFRNMIYDYIAKNRYKWYGKKDFCLLPSKELKTKFLE